MSDLPVGWSVQEAGLPIVLRLSPAGLDAIYPLTVEDIAQPAAV